MYVSRVLFADGIGRVSSAKNFAAYFVLIAALGLPTYGTKRIAEVNDNKMELGKVFAELYLINMISSIMCSIAYLSVIMALPKCREELPLYLVTGLQIVLNIFNIDWFYQGTEDYGYILKRSLAVKVLSLVFILVFVKNTDDYLLYALASILGTAVNYIFNMMHLRGRLTIRMHHLEIRKHLRTLFFLLGSTIAIEIYTLSDITMLTFMTDSTHVGYYTNSMNGVKTIKEFIVAICTVLLPRLSYIYASKDLESFCALVRKGIKVLFFFGVPAFVGCVILADSLIMILFGEDFRPAVTTTRILAVSIVTIAVSNFLGHNTLIVVGKEKTVLKVSVISAVLNIVLNAFLIQMMSENGAALASILCELLVCVLYVTYVSRYLCKLRMDRDEVSVIVASALMAGAVWTIRQIHMNVYLDCFISVMIGLNTFMLCTFILKHSVAIALMNKVRSRWKRRSIK